MCRSKVEGGRRCPSHMLEALQVRELALESAKELVEIIQADLRAGVPVEDADLIDAMTELRELEFEVIETRRAYYSTATGLAELKAKTEAEGLSDERRAALTNQLEQAEKDFIQKAEAGEKARKKQASLRAELTAQGVDPETIDSIIALAAKHKGSLYPRPVGYYQNGLAKAKEKLEAATEDYEARVAAIFQQGLKPEVETRALAEEDRRFEKAAKPLKAKVAEWRLAYESTVYGQMDLQERVTLDLENLERAREWAIKAGDEKQAQELTLKHARIWAAGWQRLRRVQRLHRTGLSDRRNSELVMKMIKEASKEVGGDPKAATAAWLKPKEFTNPRRQDPAAAKSAISVHVTEADEAAIRQAFEGSGAYKETGEAGFADFMASRVTASPLSRMGKQTLEQAQEKVEIFDVGKPSRHKTSKDGHRSAVLRVSLSEADRQTLKFRAEALHMTVSSYCRAMAIQSGNPFQVQNDRSRKHRFLKLKQCRKVLDSGALNKGA